MMEDLQHGKVFSPEAPDMKAAEKLVKERKPNYFSYADWQKIDSLEIQRAAGTEAPRLKFTTIKEMLAAVGR